MSLFEEYAPRPAGAAPPGSPRVEIRSAASDDVEALAAIAQERHGDDLATHRARFSREIAAQAAVPDRLLLVAALAGAAVGYGRVRHHLPPPDAPANAAPAGWYLSGVVVARRHRRRGIGADLTGRRLAWVAQRAREAWYFANARNRVSIDLHRRFGFIAVTRDFVFPGTSFEGGVGVLFRSLLW